MTHVASHGLNASMGFKELTGDGFGDEVKLSKVSLYVSRIERLVSLGENISQLS